MEGGWKWPSIWYLDLNRSSYVLMKLRIQELNYEVRNLKFWWLLIPWFKIFCVHEVDRMEGGPKWLSICYLNVNQSSYVLMKFGVWYLTFHNVYLHYHLLKCYMYVGDFLSEYGMTSLKCTFPTMFKDVLAKIGVFRDAWLKMWGLYGVDLVGSYLSCPWTWYLDVNQRWNDRLKFWMLVIHTIIMLHL